MSNSSLLYLFHKPYNCLSQFTKEHPDHITLSDYLNVASDVYPIGRLDKDSEGLLLLSANKEIVHRILHPKSKLAKTYYVQVEGVITQSAIDQLTNGIDINLKGKIHHTLPAIVQQMEEPILQKRNPPIRTRKNIPTSWASIQIVEGKNRQVRRMFSKVGFPVLRLVRYSIGKWDIDGLQQGECRTIEL